ncbi:putative oxidoreductase [Luteimonas cucumeris]|uniref:Putative oxidoreductase n=1 Tax=Luteimonas cucumeris TaxID=985012 RepID=A0A562KY29_9GAMM|nr:DoxX family protein [Luteimonas cucumeris]TWI00349.1 putative oxidoreductase [Luteimonas cucumeris]
MNQAAQQDLGKLVLRVALGVLILLHGIAKLRFGLDPIAGMLQSHGLPHYLAYGALVGEVLAPLLLILGWYARIGAALVAVNMLFAFALAHMGQLTQLNGQGGWALELQAMFLASAVALLLLGPGKYSLNQR